MNLSHTKAFTYQTSVLLTIFHLVFSISLAWSLLSVIYCYPFAIVSSQARMRLSYHLSANSTSSFPLPLRHFFGRLPRNSTFLSSQRLIFWSYLTIVETWSEFSCNKVVDFRSCSFNLAFSAFKSFNTSSLINSIEFFFISFYKDSLVRCFRFAKA